jgi:hypothetical protein
MEIPFDKQEGTDFDWFGVDEEHLIAHFTTAGFKRLPPSVASSEPDLKIVTDYFENRAPATGTHRTDIASLTDALGTKGAQERANLESWLAMADRGLFSFDIEPYVSLRSTYFRVAVPEVPLTILELPSEVRKIVSRTLLREVHLKVQDRVSYEETLRI